MVCFLPGGRQIGEPPSQGNRGLYYGKFFDRWDGVSAKIKEGEKLAWIKANSKDKCPSAARAAKRVALLAKAYGGDARTYITTGPFVTGIGLSHPIENGFLWHHTLGVPYLPGSSVKGLLRAWARDWLQEDKELADAIADLFGRDAEHPKGTAAGKLIAFDALSVGPIELIAEIVTPHDGGWRISNDPARNPPGDWVSPNPIPFLAVKEGALLQFAFAARAGGTSKDVENAFEYLSDALDWIGSGAKTAVGFGRFAEASKRPLAVGDRVRIKSENSDNKLRGRTGVVETVYDEMSKARLKLDGGGKGSSPVVEFAMLERIDEGE